MRKKAAEAPLSSTGTQTGSMLQVEIAIDPVRTIRKKANRAPVTAAKAPKARMACWVTRSMPNPDDPGAAKPFAPAHSPIPPFRRSIPAAEMDGRSMAYDDLKEFDGGAYSGMAVGGRHVWHYTDAIWREEKMAPDRWDFTLTSVKRRDEPSPPGSGAPSLTEYHWYLLAHQWVRKIDADSYATFMSGAKYKLAHKRPHWCAWSDEYPGNRTSREAVLAILEATRDRLAAEDGARTIWEAVRP